MEETDKRLNRRRLDTGWRRRMTQAREKEGEKTRGAGILAREAKPEARGGESWAGQEDARRAKKAVEDRKETITVGSHASRK